MRTGHARDALDEALRCQAAIDHREASFVSHFKSWVESPDRRCVEKSVHLAHWTSHSRQIVCQNHIETIYRAFITRICCTLLRQIHSSLCCTNLWVVWNLQGVQSLRSPRQQKIGCGSSLRWYISNFDYDTFRGLTQKQVDEEEEGGLRGLTEVLLSYGECHFDAANQGIWATVLLLCGQFERVRCSQQPNCVSYLLTPFGKGCCCAVGAFGNRD